MGKRLHILTKSGVSRTFCLDFGCALLEGCSLYDKRMTKRLWEGLSALQMCVSRCRCSFGPLARTVQIACGFTPAATTSSSIVSAEKLSLSPRLLHIRDGCRWPCGRLCRYIGRLATSQHSSRGSPDSRARAVRVRTGLMAYLQLHFPPTAQERILIRGSPAAPSCSLSSRAGPSLGPARLHIYLVR